MISLTFLNLFILAILAVTVLFWRYVYPSRQVNLVLLLLSFSCIPLISVWRQGSYQSGDFNDHLYFFISFYHSLQNGIWFPRWSGAFCGGYGYPHIQFFYHLPYYTASLFHFALQLSFLDSQKLLICVSFLGAALAMYLWLQSEWGKRPAFMGSLLYILAPYVLAGAHFRNTLGEGMGTFLIPLILWFIKKTFDRPPRRKSLQLWYWWAIVVSYVLLILAHHVVPILTLPLVVSYFLWKMWPIQKKNYRQVVTFFCCLGLAFVMTAYHWVPILLESRLIGQVRLQQLNFPNVSSYFFSPWRFGLLNQGHHGELTWTVGYLQWVVVVLSGWCLFRKKLDRTTRKWLLFYVVWFAGLFVMLMPFTQPIWDATPILNNFQLAIRLFILITVVVGALSAILFQNWEKNLPRVQFNLLCSMTVVLLCVTTVLNWGQRAMIPDLDDAKLTLQIPNWCDEVAIPSWLPKKEFKALPQRTADLTILSGAVQLVEVKHDMEDHQYLVVSTTSAKLRENTTYFPGWTAYLDHQSIPIEFHDPLYNGIMEVTIPAGSHQLEFVYEHTPIQQKFAVVSMVGLGLWSMITLYILYRSLHA